MQFTIRQLAFDIALLFLAVMVCFTNRHAVLDVLNTAQAMILGR
jgi:hypothetical protein